MNMLNQRSWDHDCQVYLSDGEDAAPHHALCNVETECLSNEELWQEMDDAEERFMDMRERLKQRVCPGCHQRFGRKHTTRDEGKLVCKACYNKKHGELKL